MEDKVYTQNELKAQNIITTDYALNLEPGKFIAVLDMKAEARNCLRVFFTFEDSRKVMATTQWWQRYLGFYEIPVGTHLLLHYRENSRKEVYLDEQGHPLFFMLQLCERLPRHLPHPPLYPRRCGGSGGGNGAAAACRIPCCR